MSKLGTMWRQLSGHEISDPDKRADHIMHQMLIGTMVGDGNKVQVRNYIADQLKSMKQAGKAEGRRLERRALRRLIRPRLNDAMMDNCDSCCTLGHDLIQDMHRRATKPAKRKEGGR